MAKSRLGIILIIILARLTFGQDGRYAIFLKDKSGTTYSITNPIAFLSQKSIDRRIKNDVATTEEDFPVNPEYINQVNSTGAKVLHTSRWMNCVLVQVQGSELDVILALPFVSYAEYVGPPKTFSGGRIRNTKSKKDSKQNEANTFQNGMLGLSQMHAENVYGQNVTIAVFDSGFIGVDTEMPFKTLLSEGRIQYTLDLVGLSDNVYQYDDHGTEVLSVMAAEQVDVYVGGAPKANYQLYLTEDESEEVRIEEYNWLIAAEKADSAGADVINSSLGYNLFDDPTMDYSTDQLDGNTAVVSLAAAKATAKGILVVVSAGNEGNEPWKFVDPPADVDGVLAVGSITNSGNLSSFSSIGPTADGRTKPDVVALGSSVSVVKSNGSTGFSSGTSLSAPLVTSLVAGLIQIFPELTVEELYQLVISSGDIYDTPNNQKGFGVPNYLRAKLILGVEEPGPSSDIAIFPNPIMDGLLKIKTGGEAGQTVNFSIYTLTGRTLMKSEAVVPLGDNQIELDVTGLSSGLYILQVEVKNQLKTIRLVKF